MELRTIILDLVDLGVKSAKEKSINNLIPI